MAIDGKALSLGDRDLFAGWQQPVSNSYYSFFDRDNGCLVLVDADVKRRSAHGDDRCRGEDSMVPGTTAQALDVNLDAPKKDVDQISEAAGILPKNNVRVGVNDKRAAVTNF